MIFSIEGRIDRLDGGGTFSVRLGGNRRAASGTAPTWKGFGSVILLDSARQFGQSVAMDCPPQGLRYALQLQLIAIEALKTFAKPESSTMLSPARAAPV